ncbi:hypothetical protein N3K66_006341 [Trichothecium roseum]|uniref:Uncharacterized protein n=1 Tax=Trichothecium roseum TaxID=47278 RepID=A0ACC0UV44_9HYPO|nr:hypothetical protein N3K66_006341 [Trichothecium roseum]
MKFSATALVALLSATAFAAPAPAAEVKAMSAQQTWTIEGVKRVCDKADATCNWSLTVNAAGSRQACNFAVKKSGETPASRSSGTGANCGPYTVTTGWSGQFGPDAGFTTLAVVNNAKKLVAWPAYTDKQLAGGKVVKPDQSYPVQNFPQ